jgi:RNA polymerase subunit RPABC4/transcription elongation factor Spt4
MPKVGDVVKDTEASLVAKQSGMDIPPAHWDECSNCARLYPRPDTSTDRVCAPCGLKWVIAFIREGENKS